MLVTAVCGIGVGSQIVKALRLSKHGYYIVGLDSEVLSIGFNNVDKFYNVPSAASQDYIDILLNICKAESIKVIFCGSEIELKRISPERNRFIEMGIFFPYNNQRILDLCFNKSDTIKWLEYNNFLFPRSIVVYSPEELEAVYDFPVVLKPHINSGGSTNVFIAQDKKELYFIGNYLLSICNEFMIQQYIGSTHEEYTVGILFDMEGSLINSIVIKKNIFFYLSNRLKVKNKTNKKELGDTLAISSGISQGEINNFPVIAQQCEIITKKMNCVSAVNIQCRVVNDDVYVFEINPRFSGTTSLRAIVGYNEPDILIQKHFFNYKPKKYFKYNKGIILRGIYEDYIPFKNV